MTSENFKNNRKHMLTHPSQGIYHKVLCVCSGGLLRSPTAAYVLSMNPYYYNTRSAGMIPKYALIQCDQHLIDWADEIICMDKKHLKLLKKFDLTGKLVYCLGISDDYMYRDPALIELIEKRYNEVQCESSI